jgi:hypothetical protein
MVCPRCNRGICNDGDVNCKLCSSLTDEELAKAKFEAIPVRGGKFSKGQIIDKQ